MIKFFRTIRKELVETGKTSKYLKYAIGEIVLVVIGILIALSINNWNEVRKQRNEERELLGNLKLEFSRKLMELEGKNDGRMINIEEIDQLLKIIADENDEIPEGEMMTLLENISTWFYVNEEFSIIEMLFYSGKINTISNDSLKSRIIAWPDKMEEMLEEQRVLQDVIENRLNPLVQDYVSLTNRMYHYSIKHPNSWIGDETIEGKYPNDFKGLIRDRKFESLISYKKLLLNINYKDSEVLINDTKAILDLINEAL